MARSLRLQIYLAIALLTLLFAAAALYSMRVIALQHNDDALLQLAARLQYVQQHLTVQAMQYAEHAPRDYPSYYRDLNFYFQDLQRSRSELDALIGAFASDRFDALVADTAMGMRPTLPPRTAAIGTELGSAWRDFTARLDERIGDDPANPRLEWAAQAVNASHAALEELIGRLLATLEAEVAARAAQADRINRWLLGGAILLALGIGAWFQVRVVGPLARAVAGFEQVARGDFASRVPVGRDDEIGRLAAAFNRLADRLDNLRRLLTGLEQGGELDDTMRTLAESLPRLLPLDWIGVLVVGVDGRIHLERAYADGAPDACGQLSFETDQTLLDECIRTGRPLHIGDVAQTARLSSRYRFLRHLAGLGRHDAVFLPVGGDGGRTGVAVFASRFPNQYRQEHLELLGNLGVLVGVSLGRTLQLAEKRRLASIGQFASGIVHELRSPLATITLALEHLASRESLSDGGMRRVQLATAEVARLERLLGDMLLYAKPLVLERSAQDLAALIAATLALVEPEHAARRVRIETAIEPLPPLACDPDRMRQVLLNLLRNALEASPDGATVELRCCRDGPTALRLEIGNRGPAIPADRLARLFEPFYTSKPGGTGLGLAIVERIVTAHGGRITLHADAGETRAVVRLPLAADGEAPAPSPTAEGSGG